MTNDDGTFLFETKPLLFCYHFNGDNSLSFPSTKQLQLTNEWSIEIVFRCRSHRCKLVSKNNDGSTGYSIGLYDGKLWTTTYGINENYSKVAIEEEKWNHCLIMYNRGMVSYHVGGKLIQQVPGKYPVYDSHILSDLYIGQQGDEKLFFKGDIALVRIYNKVLEKNMILNLPKNYPKNLCVYHLQFLTPNPTKPIKIEQKKEDEREIEGDAIYELKNHLPSKISKEFISKLSHDLLPKLRVENFDLEDESIVILRTYHNTFVSTDDSKSYIFQTKKITKNCFFEAEMLNSDDEKNEKQKLCFKQDNIIYFSCMGINNQFQLSTLKCSIENFQRNHSSVRELKKEIPKSYQFEMESKNQKYYISNCFGQYLSARYDFQGTFNFQKNSKTWESFDVIKFMNLTDGKILIKSGDGKFLIANSNGSFGLSANRSSQGDDLFILTESIPGKFIIQTAMYNTNLTFPNTVSILGNYATHQEKITKNCFIQFLNVGRKFVMYNSYVNSFISFSKSGISVREKILLEEECEIIYL
eukprot:gene2381-2846_t